MTAQELFNTVVVGLRKQGKKSYLEGSICAYRSPDGSKCAAGQVLPDEKYKPEMERHAVFQIEVKSIFDEVVGETNIPLLIALQRVHDCNDIHVWEREWAGIAKQYGLNLP